MNLSTVEAIRLAGFQTVDGELSGIAAATGRTATMPHRHKRKNGVRATGRRSRVPPSPLGELRRPLCLMVLTRQLASHQIVTM